MILQLEARSRRLEPELDQEDGDKQMKADIFVTPERAVRDAVAKALRRGNDERAGRSHKAWQTARDRDGHPLGNSFGRDRILMRLRRQELHDSATKREEAVNHAMKRKDAAAEEKQRHQQDGSRRAGDENGGDPGSLHTATVSHGVIRITMREISQPRGPVWSDNFTGTFL